MNWQFVTTRKMKTISKEALRQVFQPVLKYLVSVITTPSSKRERKREREGFVFTADCRDTEMVVSQWCCGEAGQVVIKLHRVCKREGHL